MGSRDADDGATLEEIDEALNVGLLSPQGDDSVLEDDEEPTVDDLE